MDESLSWYEASTKHIDFKYTCSALSIDFIFHKDNKRYHLVNREIDLCGLYDETEPKDFPVGYYPICLRLNLAEPKPMEISKAIVNFLGKHKMYLKEYRIINTDTFVAYKTPDKSEKLLYGLPHNPFRHEQLFHIEAIIELDENTDYKKYLGIKIKDPIQTISTKEITELGYPFKESGISGFAILSDEEYKEYF